MAGFAPHGKCTVSWQGNLLTVSYEGVFNREGAEVLGRSLEVPLARRAGRPWVMLNDARLWEGGTPEALRAGRRISIAGRTRAWWRWRRCIPAGCSRC